MIYIILMVIAIVVIIISNKDKSKKIEIKSKSTNNSISKSSCLNIHINKKYKNLIKDDELNYQKLGIDWYDEAEVLYDDEKGNLIFISEEDSSAKYGNLLSKIYSYCGDNFYAIVGHEGEKEKYKFTIRNALVRRFNNYLNIKEDNNALIKFYENLLLEKNNNLHSEDLIIKELFN